MPKVIEDISKIHFTVYKELKKNINEYTTYNRDNSNAMIIQIKYLS